MYPSSRTYSPNPAGKRQRQETPTIEPESKKARDATETPSSALEPEPNLEGTLLALEHLNLPGCGFSCQILSHDHHYRNHLLHLSLSSAASGPQTTERERIVVEVASDSDEMAGGATTGDGTGAPEADEPRTAEGNVSALGGDDPYTAGGGAEAPEDSPCPPPFGSGAIWMAPESSSAGARRFLGRSRPWTSMSMEDVGGSSGTAPEVDVSDIVHARESLDALEEKRRSFATMLFKEQRNFIASRDFLAQQRHDIMVAQEELSRARADLERRGAKLEEREHGLAQHEAAIDASDPTEKLQQ